ncbi:MAG: hypothetical protein NTX34_07300 [Cytophagales bacterium]|nr:hypothetical protein [Cytophagales bacterium]
MNFLILNDDLISVNGMSNFSFLFSEHLRSSYSDVNVIHYDFVNKKYFNLKENIEDGKIVIDGIYVNGHYSNFDRFFVKYGRPGLNSFFPNFNLDHTSIIIISHGWKAVVWKFNFYNIYYNLNNLTVFKYHKLKRILLYDNILFISEVSDKFRHLDYCYCLSSKTNFLFYDFAASFINESEIAFKSPDATITKLYKVLIISNPDFVKNLEFLILLLLKNRFYKRNRKYTLLSKIPSNLYFKVLYSILISLGLEIVFDQSKKNFLLSRMDYLFIPSHTEYLPIVSLEAFKVGSWVVSLNRIPSLMKFKNYRFLRK